MVLDGLIPSERFRTCLIDSEKYGIMLKGKKIFILGNDDFEGEFTHYSFDDIDWKKSELALENAVLGIFLP